MAADTGTSDVAAWFEGLFAQVEPERRPALMRLAADAVAAIVAAEAEQAEVVAAEESDVVVESGGALHAAFAESIDRAQLLVPLLRHGVPLVGDDSGTAAAARFGVVVPGDRVRVAVTQEEAAAAAGRAQPAERTRSAGRGGLSVVLPQEVAENLLDWVGPDLAAEYVVAVVDQQVQRDRLAALVEQLENEAASEAQEGTAGAGTGTEEP